MSSGSELEIISPSLTSVFHQQQIDLTALVANKFGQAAQDSLQNLISIRTPVSGTNALKVGDKAPNFHLNNQNGSAVHLQHYLAKGPVVLNWYRGDWCPYCNTALRGHQKHLNNYRKLGAEFFALSGLLPDATAAAAKVNEVTFDVLSDIGLNVANEFGLTWEIDQTHKEFLAKFGVDWKKIYGNEEYRLPISATYVIDVDGTVAFADVVLDWRRRADPVDVEAALLKLKNKH